MCIHIPPPGQSLCLCKHESMEADLIIQAQAEVIAALMRRISGGPIKINLIST